jgi:hypothetical protein
MSEKCVFILWKNNINLEKMLFESIYNEKCFTIFKYMKFTINLEEKYKLLNRCYYPDKVPLTDGRITEGDIKVIIVQDNLIEYDNLSVTSGKIEIVNTKCVRVKQLIRKKYDYTFIHSSNDLNEYNQTVSAFKLYDLIESKYDFIDINKLLNVRWIELYKKYDLKYIKDFYNYRYLEGDSDKYIDYITTKARSLPKHSSDNYDKLIKNFDHKNYNSSNSNLVVIQKNLNNSYVIIDGAHRAAILYKNNIKKIRVKIKDNFSINNYFLLSTTGKTYNYINCYNILVVLKFTKFLEDNSINYCFLRGFEKLPDNVDSDIDIVVSDIDIVLQFFNSITKEFINNKNITLKFTDEIKDGNPGGKILSYKNYPFSVKYHSYKLEIYENDNKIDYPSWRLDIYNYIVFDKPVNPEYYYNVLENSIKSKFFMIPSLEDRIVMLFYREYYEIAGSFREKKKKQLFNMLNELNYGYIPSKSSLIDFRKVIIMHPPNICNIEVFKNFDRESITVNLINDAISSEGIYFGKLDIDSNEEFKLSFEAKANNNKSKGKQFSIYTGNKYIDLENPLCDINYNKYELISNFNFSSKSVYRIKLINGKKNDSFTIKNIELNYLKKISKFENNNVDTQNNIIYLDNLKKTFLKALPNIKFEKFIESVILHKYIPEKEEFFKEYVN